MRECKSEGGLERKRAAKPAGYRMLRPTSKQGERRGEQVKGRAREREGVGMGPRPRACVGVAAHCDLCSPTSRSTARRAPPAGATQSAWRTPARARAKGQVRALNSQSRSVGAFAHRATCARGRSRRWAAAAMRNAEVRDEGVRRCCMGARLRGRSAGGGECRAQSKRAVSAPTRIAATSCLYLRIGSQLLMPLPFLKAACAPSALQTLLTPLWCRLLRRLPAAATQPGSAAMCRPAQSQSLFP
eukprot:2341168-Pleurochrysis_carterae.AAC.1